MLKPFGCGAPATLVGPAQASSLPRRTHTGNAIHHGGIDALSRNGRQWKVKPEGRPAALVAYDVRAPAMLLMALARPAAVQSRFRHAATDIASVPTSLEDVGRSAAAMPTP